MSKTSQENKVLDFMRYHGSITQRQAIYLGCYRLSGRIYDLRKRGIGIKTDMVEVKNADGSKSLIARYSIGENQNG